MIFDGGGTRPERRAGETRWLGEGTWLGEMTRLDSLVGLSE